MVTWCVAPILEELTHLAHSARIVNAGKGVATSLNSHLSSERFKHMHLKIKDGNIGQDLKFSRIRRVTGYLVGDLSRWNSGKLAEQAERVKHQ